MNLLIISDEKCRQCGRCVRTCPTNALKIDRKKVSLIKSRCILCGACYKYCPHGAFIALTGVDQVLGLLESDEKVIACIDPTFPAVLIKGTPGQLVTALKKLGFHEVWESAFGGELVIQAYNKLLNHNRKSSYISSFCPSLVLYIEKFVPHLAKKLAPVVSPMIATGMAVKKLRGEHVKVVFIGSCISRAYERRSRHVEKCIDYVLTYRDILKIFEEKSINREEQKPSAFDGPRPHSGGLLSIAGGLSRCIGFKSDIMNLDYVVAAGPDRAMRTIQQFQDGTIRSKFLDILFCAGCIYGPIVDKNISGPSRKQNVVDYVKSQYNKKRKTQHFIQEKLKDIDLTRSFSPKDITFPDPAEKEINLVLKKLNKLYPDKNLDCGACGYHTCREKAIAVVQGLAKEEMCPHYLVERLHGFYSRLEKSHKQLKTSHEQLEQAQRQLIQTEKMASLGQLAAGVAHELNNPLGTITMFARMLQKELAGDKKKKHDIDLIVQEADRAAKIVKDLLSFSRETKIKPGLVNVNHVIEEALSLLSKQSLFHNIDIQKELNDSIPNTFADPDLLKQVFLNIILNSAQAMDDKGSLTIKSQSAKKKEEIQIQIGDTGKGIPQENLHRLFDPFFTTKEKGTGLGLALAYGIVSKHQGKIQVDSEIGKGTTFTIILPVLDQKEWEKSDKSFVEIKRSKEGDKVGIKEQNLIG